MLKREVHIVISEWKQISLLCEKLKQYDHYVKLNFLAYSAISEAFIMIMYESRCIYCLGYIWNSKKKNLCTTSYCSILSVTMFWNEFLYIFYLHTQVNKHIIICTQLHSGKVKPKGKERETHIPKVQTMKGRSIYSVLKWHINIQLTYFFCLFNDYIWWQIFLIRRVTEQQMCKIENWKYLNRCIIFILHELIRNVESTFGKSTLEKHMWKAHWKKN